MRQYAVRNNGGLWLTRSTGEYGNVFTDELEKATLFNNKKSASLYAGHHSLLKGEVHIVAFELKKVEVFHGGASYRKEEKLTPQKFKPSRKLRLSK